MTNQTNADLIATAKAMREQLGEEPKSWSILALWFETASRLEAADQLAEIRGETIRTYERENADWERRVHIAERKAAEYAAVVEKVCELPRYSVPDPVMSWSAVDGEDLEHALATAPADALREHDAALIDSLMEGIGSGAYTHQVGEGIEVALDQLHAAKAELREGKP